MRFVDSCLVTMLLFGRKSSEHRPRLSKIEQEHSERKSIHSCLFGLGSGSSSPFDVYCQCVSFFSIINRLKVFICLCTGVCRKFVDVKNAQDAREVHEMSKYILLYNNVILYIIMYYILYIIILLYSIFYYIKYNSYNKFLNKVIILVIVIDR